MQVLLRPVANRYLERLNESDNSRIVQSFKGTAGRRYKAIVRTSRLLSAESGKIPGIIPL
jgi:CHAD domain-containing protein